MPVMTSPVSGVFAPQSVTIVQNGAAQSPKAKDSGGGFGEFLDMINPLHHIPLVGQIYRAVTGDTISDRARLAGGGLFAGPIGVGIAAGTIALRSDKTSDAPGPSREMEIAPAQSEQGEVSPLPTDGYQDIAAQYWTPGSLAALKASLGDLDVPQASEDDDAQLAAPVPQVESTPLPAPGSPFLTQMLSNLDKYDALKP